MGYTAPQVPPMTTAVDSADGSAAPIATPDLIRALVDSGPGISDLVFSPGRAPQVERHGELVSVNVPDLQTVRPEDTTRIALDLIGSNEQAQRSLREQGACDFSYSLPERARFRVNVF